ncbi:MAG TPA: ABC transporter permease [Ilumatobacteraceae bacterium]
MTAVAYAGVRTAKGRGSARRAVARWALRLFVRERRQQTVVVVVIAIAVAAAVCSVATVYNTPATQAGRFGTAKQLISYGSSDPAAIADAVAAAGASLGTIEVIGHSELAIPGSTETYDVRVQDPAGVYAASTLRLRDGRLPTASLEAAVTRDVAATFAVSIGGSIPIGGTARTVVGIVENPLDLGDQFVLQPPSSGPSRSITILADATGPQVEHLRLAGGNTNIEERGSDVSKAAAAGMLAASTVVFLLVALVAAAGFAVTAQRRMRQLGMLAALGATDRHLKLVLLVHGAIVGVVASLSGATLGIGIWFVVAHRLERAVHHRIDPMNLPWALLIGAMVAGLLVPIAAAWWPSRSMPRMSIVDAISARPPMPRRARASIIGGVVFLAGGVGLMAASNQSNPVLVVGGSIALVIGMLFVCPTAIKVIATLGRRAPVATRIAVRDLGRYQARAGAALGAVSLALGIPIAILLIATAADRTAVESAGKGNLAETQMLVTIRAQRGDTPVATQLTETQIENANTAMAHIAAALGDPTVVPVDLAVDSANQGDGHPIIDLAVPTPGDPNHYNAVKLFVGSPELLSFLHIDASTIPDGTEVLSSVPNVILAGLRSRGETTTTSPIGPPEYSSLPRAFITDAGLAKHDLHRAPSGWILQARGALTPAQVASSRHLAASAGLTIETRHGVPTHSALKTASTAAGAVFALTIVAMTVGTIRSEAADELRTLTATGANSTIRRRLTATTAASLALAGVIVGTLGAYLGLVGAYAHHLGRLGDVPIVHLVVAIVGVPVLSGLVGWCLGGREPTTFARSFGD